jgi:alpha-galactosidase/6-phospho-beta-glucosidase family protein
MPRIEFIGAGSTVFTKNLIGDLLAFPELAHTTTLALMDIDAERLHTSEIVARRLTETLGARATVDATLDRREALDGADYVVTSFQVGGYRPATVIDFEIPKRYGLRQTIADTLGVGGIMRGLRTIPVLLDICRDMEELCPDALLLQYVNPMAMLCWAAAEVSSIRTGLCHSVQYTAARPRAPTSSTATTSRSTSTRAAARPRSPSGRRSARGSRAAGRWAWSAAMSTGPTSSAPARPASRSGSTATCPTAPAMGC